MRSLKERKFFKCTMAADKEGGLTQRGESLGRGGEFKDWLLMVVRHCSHAGVLGGRVSDAVVLGTFWIIVDMSFWLAIARSYRLITLSLSLILWPLCHIVLGHFRIFLSMSYKKVLEFCLSVLTRRWRGFQNSGQIKETHFILLFVSIFKIF